jgi:hypothetical protein
VYVQHIRQRLLFPLSLCLGLESFCDFMQRTLFFMTTLVLLLSCFYCTSKLRNNEIMMPAVHGLPLSGCLMFDAHFRAAEHSPPNSKGDFLCMSI